MNSRRRRRRREGGHAVAVWLERREVMATSAWECVSFKCVKVYHLWI